MLAPASPPCNFCRLWFLAVFLHAIFVSAQIRAQQTQVPGATGIAPGPTACAWADGRRVPIGASMFGKDSARVVITGCRPDLPASTRGGQAATFEDLSVLWRGGQVRRR